MPTVTNRWTGLLAVCLALAMPGAVAWGQFIQLEPPGQREFILDKAGLITPEHEQQIRAICDKLLTERAIPIVVVTIESMAQYGGRYSRIETFATILFNQWGIGQEQVNGSDWNTGILLLVSTGDRTARAGYALSAMAACRSPSAWYAWSNSRMERSYTGRVSGRGG